MCRLGTSVDGAAAEEALRACSPARGLLTAGLTVSCASCGGCAPAKRRAVLRARPCHRVNRWRTESDDATRPAAGSGAASSSSPGANETLCPRCPGNGSGLAAASEMASRLEAAAAEEAAASADELPARRNEPRHDRFAEGDGGTATFGGRTGEAPKAGEPGGNAGEAAPERSIGLAPPPGTPPVLTPTEHRSIGEPAHKSTGDVGRREWLPCGEPYACAAAA